MSNLSVIYGSTTGNTEAAAQQIAAALGGSAVNVNDATAADFAADLLVLGTSTWGAGDLQDDWAAALGKLQEADLAGKKVAVFGEGDQMGFGDTFVSAMGTLAEEAEKKGAALVGLWPAEGYQHTASAAQRGDKFVGLALDEMNDADKTADRIAAWTAQVKAEAGL